MGIFLTALLIGDTIASKLFVIDVPLGFTTFSATLSVGAIWFPITFLLTDVVNEFYGVVGARTMTFIGFWMALVAFIILYVARMIPAASFSPISQPVFDKVFGNANRIFVASLCAYLVGQLVDIAIFQHLKKLTRSKHVWLRATGSTLISQLIDTLIVTYVAFYGQISATQLRSAATTSYLVKILVAVGLTPLVYSLHGVLHRRLGMTPLSPETRSPGWVDLELGP